MNTWIAAQAAADSAMITVLTTIGQNKKSG